MIFLIENPFNEFLKANSLWIALFFFLLIVAILLIVFLTSSRRGKNVDKPLSVDKNLLVNALGGFENIASLEAKGSRLVVVLKDSALIDRKALKENGVLSIIAMSKKITLVTSGDAEAIRQSIEGK